MTYLVTDNCIKCKYMDCVEVCPVDCFYEGENMLVIHPEEGIDCSVCVPECPVDVIKPDSAPGMEMWLELNRKYRDISPSQQALAQSPSRERHYANRNAVPSRDEEWAVIRIVHGVK